MLDSVPANKIFGFGGDYRYPELSYGHLVIARRNIATVLAARVENGALRKKRPPKLRDGCFTTIRQRFSPGHCPQKTEFSLYSPKTRRRRSEISPMWRSSPPRATINGIRFSDDRAAPSSAYNRSYLLSDICVKPAPAAAIPLAPLRSQDPAGRSGASLSHSAGSDSLQPRSFRRGRCAAAPHTPHCGSRLEYSPFSIAANVPPMASIRSMYSAASRSIRSVSLLDVVAAAQRIGRLRNSALVRDNLLRPQGESGGFFRR